MPSKKNVGGHRPMKVASRWLLAFASLSDRAAERAHKERAPPIEASPKLCMIVLLKPSFFKNSATFTMVFLS